MSHHVPDWRETTHAGRAAAASQVTDKQWFTTDMTRHFRRTAGGVYQPLDKWRGYYHVDDYGGNMATLFTALAAAGVTSAFIKMGSGLYGAWTTPPGNWHIEGAGSEGRGLNAALTRIAGALTFGGVSQVYATIKNITLITNNPIAFTAGANVALRFENCGLTVGIDLGSGGAGSVFTLFFDNCTLRGDFGTSAIFNNPATPQFIQLQVKNCRLEGNTGTTPVVDLYGSNNACQLVTNSNWLAKSGGPIFRLGGTFGGAVISDSHDTQDANYTLYDQVAGSNVASLLIANNEKVSGDQPLVQPAFILINGNCQRLAINGNNIYGCNGFLQFANSANCDIAIAGNSLSRFNGTALNNALIDIPQANTKAAIAGNIGLGGALVPNVPYNYGIFCNAANAIAANGNKFSGAIAFSNNAITAGNI